MLRKMNNYLTYESALLALLNYLRKEWDLTGKSMTALYLSVVPDTDSVAEV